MNLDGLLDLFKRIIGGIGVEILQIGVGGTTASRESTPILSTTYGYEDSTHYFREVIVAKKYEGVLPPLPVAALGGTSTQENLPDSPRDAEADAKTHLGISSNYQLDRWWVKSTDTSSVGQFSDPTSSNYDFKFRVTATSNGSVIALLDYYERNISSSRKDYWILAAHAGTGSGPAVDPDGTQFSDNNNPAPSSLETAAGNTFGANQYARWEIKEETTKLSPTQNFPTSWFAT